MKTRLVILPAALVLTLITGFYLLSGKDGQPSAQSKKPAPVSVITAKKQTLTEGFEAQGSANAIESIEITAPVAEIITRINFEDGQKVDAGEVLIQLRQDDLIASKQFALAELAENKREYERLEALVSKGAAPSSQLDARRTLLSKSEANLNKISAELNKRTIVAPFSGYLGLRNFSVGAFVRPGEVITTLDDLSSIKLEVQVPAKFLPKLKPGLALTASAPALGDDSLFKGELTYIDSRVDPTTRSIRIRALLPNEGLVLKPGLFMSIQLLSEPREAIMVPEIAIISERDEHFVYLVNEQEKVEKRAVILGARKPDLVEVREGLVEGEKIIVEGIVKVQPGQAVSQANWQGKDS